MDEKHSSNTFQNQNWFDSLPEEEQKEYFEEHEAEYWININKEYETDY